MTGSAAKRRLARAVVVPLALVGGIAYLGLRRGASGPEWRGVAAPGPAAAEASRLEPARGSDEDDARVPVAQAAEPSAPAEAPLARAPETAAGGLATLTLRVLCAGSDEPVPNARATVWVADETDAARRERRVGTDGDGAAVLAGLAPGRCDVELAAGVRDSVVLEAGEERELVLRLAGQRVAGRVTDVAGEPVAGAAILLDGEPWTRTGGEGDYEVGCYGNRHWIAAAADGYAPSAPAALPAFAPGEEHRRDLVLGANGGVVEGRVVERTGQPVEGAAVRLSLAPFDERTRALPPRLRPWWRGPPSAVDGSFRFEGAPLGVLSLRALREGYAPAEAEVELTRAGESAYAELVLARGGVVTGTVTDEGGRPVADAWVRWLPYEPGISNTRSAPDGTYTLTSVPAGTVRLAAGAEIGRAEGEVELSEGGAARWNPVLSGGLVIRGRVLRESGEPVAGVLAVRPTRESDTLWHASDTTGPDGSFRLTGCEPDGNRVVVRLSIQQGEVLAAVDDVVPGPEELVLVVRDADWPSGWIEGRVLDEAGAPLTAAVVFVREEDGDGFGLPVGLDGAFRLGPFHPGRYALTVTAEGYFSRELDFRALAPDATLDFGTSSLERGCYVDVRLELPSGDLYSGDASLSVKTPESPLGVHFSVRSGLARIGPLHAGRYAATASWGLNTADTGAREVLLAVTCEEGAVQTIPLE